MRDSAFNTLGDVKRLNKAQGYHFFDDDTMSFFKSRLVAGLIGGRFFVTSERGPSGVRAYTVRRARDDGTIETCGEFQGYPTRGQALTAARRLARFEVKS